MSTGGSWVPQATLDAWNVTELEFALALAAIVFGVLCPFTICVLCFCLRAPPVESKYREPPSDALPPAPAPVPPKEPEPERIAIDMESDKLIAINGRPVVGGRKGVSYMPDLSIVVTPNRPHIGAAWGSGAAAADDGAAGFGVGQAQGQFGYAEYDGVLGPEMGGQAGAHHGGSYEAEESSWEAERIEGLEHRVRMLEATVVAVRGNALPPLDHRPVGGKPPAATSRPSGSVVATPAHVDGAVGDRYRIAEHGQGDAADGGAVNARLTFDIA